MGIELGAVMKRASTGLEAGTGAFSGGWLAGWPPERAEQGCMVRVFSPLRTGVQTEGSEAPERVHKGF
jgi:hypothetical protein